MEKYTKPTIVTVPCFSGAPWELEQLTALQHRPLRTMRLPEELDNVAAYADFVANQVRDLNSYVLVGDSFGAVVSLAGDSPTRLIPTVCVFSAGTSAIVDNIPVAATLIPIIKSIGGMGVAQEPLWWSLVLGSNLGGNGTPIGSISCVIALHTLKKEAKISVGWGEIIKLGGMIMIVQVVGAVVYLLLLQSLNAFPALD